MAALKAISEPAIPHNKQRSSHRHKAIGAKYRLPVKQQQHHAGEILISAYDVANSLSSGAPAPGNVATQRAKRREAAFMVTAKHTSRS